MLVPLGIALAIVDATEVVALATLGVVILGIAFVTLFSVDIAVPLGVAIFGVVTVEPFGVVEPLSNKLFTDFAKLKSLLLSSFSCAKRFLVKFCFPSPNNVFAAALL